MQLVQTAIDNGTSTYCTERCPPEDHNQLFYLNKQFKLFLHWFIQSESVPTFCERDINTYCVVDRSY